MLSKDGEFTYWHCQEFFCLSLQSMTMLLIMVNPLLTPPPSKISPLPLISPPLPSPNYSSLINDRHVLINHNCKTLCGLTRDGLFTNYMYNFRFDSSPPTFLFLSFSTKCIFFILGFAEFVGRCYIWNLGRISFGLFFNWLWSYILLSFIQSFWKSSFAAVLS